MYYFVPVEKQGQTLALLVGVIDCESLPDVFKTMAYNGEAFSCLNDYKDGSFIMDDWHERLGKLTGGCMNRKMHIINSSRLHNRSCYNKCLEE